jgi:geranylgeranyl pyrophosphate synthase
MAILTGDALLTRAMGVLAQAPQQTSDPRAKMVAELASAAGQTGMVAGQVADMELCEIPENIAGLEFIHARKTGCMLQAAARLGAIAAKAGPDIIDALGQYAAKLGLAFQIFDDLLDGTASAGQLGKTPGKDALAGKKTYLTILGYERAQELGQELTNRAIEALSPLGDKARPLKTLAKLLVKREY